MAFPEIIKITEAGRKSLKKLPPQVRLRILRKLAEYNEKPELSAQDIKKLMDTHPARYRVRIGDYRAVGTLDGEKLLLHSFVDRKNL